MNDKLTLELTRQQAHQLLSMYQDLMRIADLRAPEVDWWRSDVADAIIKQIEAFVEGRQQ